MANRAEPPKLILISEGWAWTPWYIKIMDTVSSTVYVRYMNTQTLNSESCLISSFLIIQANCPDSPTRNKAKNALSLAGPISWLGGAKIGKFWEMQGEKQKTATNCCSFLSVFSIWLAKRHFPKRSAWVPVRISLISLIVFSLL